MTETAPPLLVLYGSETGNAQDVAERIGREAGRRQLVARAMPMDAYDIAQFPGEKLVMFVTATTGQGDPPANMRKFWRFLLRKSLPPDSLAGMEVAVFGLGDSGYQKYNTTAKKLAARLVQLGAQEVLEKGLGDDQATCGYYSALEPWLQRLWAALALRFPPPPGAPEVTPGAKKLDPPRFRVTTIEGQQESRKDATSGADAEEERARRAVAAASALRAVRDAASGIPPQPASAGACQDRPAFARLEANERLTTLDHFQTTEGIRALAIREDTHGSEKSIDEHSHLRT